MQSFGESGSPQRALRRQAEIALAATRQPILVQQAFALVQPCQSRDDECELQAIYDGVKANVRYVSDTRDVDRYVRPDRLLEMCQQGACAGDCDDHAMLLAALAYAIGFRTGLRAYVPSDQNSELHVYAVAAFPKHEANRLVGLDTTVSTADVGWEPHTNGCRYWTVMLP